MQEIEELKRQGISLRAISRLTGYDRKTIRKYLVRPDGVPVYGPRAKQPGKLERFKAYLEERMRAGVWNARVAGIVSAKDFGRRVVLEGRSLEGTKVGDIMTSPVITVGPTTTVSEAMAVMTPNRIRHLPVMDEDRLAGIVAMSDLARAVIAERAFTIDQLHGYVGHKYPV